jgi:hypothetical protein
MAIVGPVVVSAGLPGGSSAALNVTAPGVIKAAPGILMRIAVIAAGSAGNLTINDATSTGGARVLRVTRFYDLKTSNPGMAS